LIVYETKLRRNKKDTLYYIYVLEQTPLFIHLFIYKKKEARKEDLKEREREERSTIRRLLFATTRKKKLCRN
jgi:hypothetical protein